MCKKKKKKKEGRQHVAQYSPGTSCESPLTTANILCPWIAFPKKGRSRLHSIQVDQALGFSRQPAPAGPCNYSGNASETHHQHIVSQAHQSGTLNLRCTI
jgi:hypothetical protein